MTATPTPHRIVPQVLSNVTRNVDDLNRPRGHNAAASNNGGLIVWEQELARFAWRRKRQAVGMMIPTDILDCIFCVRVL